MRIMNSETGDVKFSMVVRIKCNNALSQNIMKIKLNPEEALVEWEEEGKRYFEAIAVLIEAGYFKVKGKDLVYGASAGRDFLGRSLEGKYAGGYPRQWVEKYFSK